MFVSIQVTWQKGSISLEIKDHKTAECTGLNVPKSGVYPLGFSCNC